jgi:hypothetical protein
VSGQSERTDAGELGLRALRDLIELFTEGALEHFDLDFDDYPRVPSGEFHELIRGYHPWGRVSRSGSTISEEYDYDDNGGGLLGMLRVVRTTRKLYFTYHLEESDGGELIYAIHSVTGYTARLLNLGLRHTTAD